MTAAAPATGNGFIDLTETSPLTVLVDSLLLRCTVSKCIEITNGSAVALERGTAGFGIVLDGSGRFMTKQQAWTVSPGDLVFLPREAAHAWCAATQSEEFRLQNWHSLETESPFRVLTGRWRGHDAAYTTIMAMLPEAMLAANREESAPWSELALQSTRDAVALREGTILQFQQVAAIKYI